MNATTVSNLTPKGAYDLFVDLFARAEKAIIALDEVYTSEWAEVVANLSTPEAVAGFGLTDTVDGRIEANTIISLGKVHNLPDAGVSVFELARALGKAFTNDTEAASKVVAAYATAKNPRSSRATMVSALNGIGRKAGTARTDAQQATTAFNRLVEKGGLDHLTDEQFAALDAAIQARKA